MSGSEIAFELTNVINERFGDGKTFDFSAAPSQLLKITRLDASGATQAFDLDVGNLTGFPADGLMTPEPLAYAINQALAADANFADMTVSYDAASQGFRFLQANSGTDSIYLSSGPSGTATNDVFGVSAQVHRCRRQHHLLWATTTGTGYGCVRCYFEQCATQWRSVHHRG